MTKVSMLTIKEALSRLKKGLLSAQELCAQCHQRIKKTKLLNIYVTEISEETLIAQAKASQENIDKGKLRPLEGILIGFKDNFCSKGIPTSCASEMLRNYIPPYNATMLNKCLDNGALLAGKLNLDEFGMGSSGLDSCHGPVKNPWNLVHRQSGQSDLDDKDFLIAGGSSGGSAAAVASGTCLAAFGSDTGGSVRIPAAFCGVVGLKPTYGLLSRHGLIPLVNSLDCPGIFTKSVEDCSIVLNAVSGHDIKDSTTVYESYGPYQLNEYTNLTGLHIGLPKEFYVKEMSEEVLSLWQHMADVLENAGARVSQVSLPHSHHSVECYSVLSNCEVASNFARYDGIEFGLRKGSETSTEELSAESRHLGFNDMVRARILSGNYFLLESNYDKYFIQAQKVRRLIADDFRRVFESGVDLLLSPTVLTEALLMSSYQKEDHTHSSRQKEIDIFCIVANLAGIPAISIPLRLSQNGLPLSLQLIGQPFGESKLLSIAHWLEQTANPPRLSLDFLDDENDNEN